MPERESAQFLNSPIVFLEPTNRCNLRCVMCPSNREMERQRGNLSEETFQQLVNELAGEQPFLNFWGWGEPILHPKIFPMIRYASDRGIKVRVSSNIEPLPDSQVETLLTSGLFMLMVPLDGISSASHESYRIGSHVDRVKYKIQLIAAQKRALNREQPYLTVLTLATKQAIPEIDQVISFCRESGVDALMIKFPNLWRTRKSDQEALALYRQFIAEESDYSRYQQSTSQEIVGHSGPCPFLDKNGAILWNGEVTTCCYDHEGSYSFGNINDPGGYQGVLESEAKQKRWETMEKRQLPICQSCDATGPRSHLIMFNTHLTQADFEFL